jgi:hypothetical protein
MVEIADEPARDGLAEEVEARLRPPRRAGSRLLLLPALSGVAAAVCAIALVQGTSEPAAERPGSHTSKWSGIEDGYNGVELAVPGERCIDAVEGSPSELAVASGTNVWLPPATSEHKVTDSWACSEGGAPVLLLDGDIQVSYEAGWSDVDREKKWRDLNADQGGDVQRINELPTLVHEGNEKAPYNQVMFVIDDTLVRLLSQKDAPIEALVSLAGAIDVKDPAFVGRADR